MKFGKGSKRWQHSGGMEAATPYSARARRENDAELVLDRVRRGIRVPIAQQIWAERQLARGGGW